MMRFTLHYRILRILTLILILTSNDSFSQKTEVDVRMVNTEKYPEISGNLWVRDPQGLDLESVKFIENDKPVAVSFGQLSKSDSLATNKQIVFLIKNAEDEAEYNWYKSVLIQAFNNGVIKSGDQVDVVAFSSMIEDHMLFPNTFSFTDSKSELIKKIDNIRNQRRLDNKGKVQTHLAINEALAKLEALKIKLPGGVFVLSDDHSISPAFTGESPGTRSKRLNIPIYGITYRKADVFYDIEELCQQTYGRYNASVESTAAANSLVEFLKEFEKRHAGVYYPFTYNTTFEKDGKSHIVKIDSKKGQSAFGLLIPSKTYMEWVKDNWILCTVILVVLIVLLIVLLLLNKNNKLKKQQIEADRQRQISQMEEQQAVADRKMQLQDNELKRIRDEELRAAQEAERQKIQAAQEQEDKRQLQKMMERGNLPWFEYRFGTESGSYQIQSPRLSVGRDESNVWRINHPTVSRKHFQLNFKDYVYTIADAGSSNGLFVNNHKISQAELKHGDCIQIGEIMLTFHI
jgi:hypothetical protein